MPLELHDRLGPPSRGGSIPSPSRWRRNRPTICVLVASATTVAGLALTLTSAAPDVWMDAAGYHVDGAVLRHDGAGAFTTSSRGVVVIEQSATGSAVAGSSLVYGSAKITARCAMTATAEHCVFRTGHEVFDAQDHLVTDGSGHRWLRRYSNGRTVTIRIPSGPVVPVPIPLGH